MKYPLLILFNKQIIRKSMAPTKISQYIYIKQPRYGVGMGRKITQWTKDEDNFIKNHYQDTDREVLIEKLGRTWKAIRLRAMKFGVKRSLDLVKKDNIRFTKKAMLDKYGVEYSTLLPSMKEKSKQTNMLKRGVEYPSQSKDVQDKVKKAVMVKYGVDNVFQAQEIKEKIERTNIERYGVSNPNQCPDIRKKSEATNIERYGVSNPFQLVGRVQEGMIKRYGEKTPLNVPELIEKKKRTSIERYGVEVASKNDEVKDKIRNTNIRIYGVSTPLKSSGVKKKIIKKNLEKYGVTNPAKNDDIKNKIYQTCYSRYGIKSFLCLEEVRRKGRELVIQRNSIGKSKGEIVFKKYLTLLDPKTEHHKEHPTVEHVIDFYLPSYDLWIQYDGDYWHGKDQRVNKGTRQYLKIQSTIARDKMENDLIPNLIRFWASEVTSAINNNTIFELIIEKVEKKISINPICHQFLKKLEWYSEDIKNLPFDIDGVKASCFYLQHEKMSEEIRSFIERYEWLGTTGFNVKWCFTARYMGVLSGVILISEPASYSTLLGADTPKYEAIIQRGATVSWSPRNLGSRLILFSCHWMVSNTSKRLFIGYADSEANERGTIYRACNFEYVGNNFGDTYSYTHPEILHPFSSRYIRRTSTFKVWCKKNNIELKHEWFKENQFKDLSKIPGDIKKEWYSWGKKIIGESNKVKLSRKSKYVLLIGLNKTEKKALKNMKTYTPQPYPKYTLSGPTTPKTTYEIST